VITILHAKWRKPTQMLRRILAISSWVFGLTLATAGPALADDRPDGAELATASSMLIVIVIFFVIGAASIWWSWSNGEFEEPEEVKYTMLGMIEDEPNYWEVDRHDEEDDLSEPTTTTPARQIVAPTAR
jgi:nitrogen fixation-related uncharacterized protein